MLATHQHVIALGLSDLGISLVFNYPHLKHSSSLLALQPLTHHSSTFIGHQSKSCLISGHLLLSPLLANQYYSWLPSPSLPLCGALQGLFFPGATVSICRQHLGNIPGLRVCCSFPLVLILSPLTKRRAMSLTDRLIPLGLSEIHSFLSIFLTSNSFFPRTLILSYMFSPSL